MITTKWSSIYFINYLLVYVKIIKTISTPTKTNVALLAIYSTISRFTKTIIQFLFTKFEPLMDTIIAGVTDRCRYWFFSFCRGSWFIWLTFWWSPSNSDRMPSSCKPFSNFNAKLQKSQLRFFRLSELDTMTFCTDFRHWPSKYQRNEGEFWYTNVLSWYSYGIMKSTCRTNRHCPLTYYSSLLSGEHFLVMLSFTRAVPSFHFKYIIRIPISWTNIGTFVIVPTCDKNGISVCLKTTASSTRLW